MGLMSRIAKILSFVRATRNGAKVSDLKCDPGGGANVTAQHFADAGDDANPLTTDFALVVPGQANGQMSVVGYVDPKNPGITAPGEKRIYARNAGGAIVVEHHLKSSGESVIFNANGTVLLRGNGSIKGFNQNGSFELKEDGSFEIISNANATYQVNADGSMKGFNDNGAFELEAGGDFVVNGVTIDTLGNVTLPTLRTVTSDNAIHQTSVLAGGKELVGHVHSGVTPGPSNTGPNV